MTESITMLFARYITSKEPALTDQEVAITAEFVAWCINREETSKPPTLSQHPPWPLKEVPNDPQPSPPA